MNIKATVNKASLFHEKYIFFDFDGVIKESVAVKTGAFVSLFHMFGGDIAIRIKQHHEENGGISRYEKIPLYLGWAGQETSSCEVNKYLYKFSKLVKQEVIQSNWVPGILSYLEKQSESKTFFVITATPQEEIEEIINVLEIKKYFEEIIGAPIKKTFAVKEVLDKYLIDVDNAVMVGDSSTDYDAAIMNNIKFILRKTKLNQRLQKKLQCKMITDFNNG